jgi:hypothetical protein
MLHQTNLEKYDHVNALVRRLQLVMLVHVVPTQRLFESGCTF